MTAALVVPALVLAVLLHRKGWFAQPWNLGCRIAGAALLATGYYASSHQLGSWVRSGASWLGSWVGKGITVGLKDPALGSAVAADLPWIIGAIGAIAFFFSIFPTLKLGRWTLFSDTLDWPLAYAAVLIPSLLDAIPGGLGNAVRWAGGLIRDLAVYAGHHSGLG